MNIELLGPRAVGKTTIGEALSRDLGIRYISLGRLARKEMETETTLGIEMNHYIENGLPYPQGLLVPLISSHLDGAQKSGGFILDGYPRRKSEAQELLLILDGLGAQIDFIFKIETSLDVLNERAKNRVFCSNCDSTSSKLDKKSSCPHCRIPWTTRNDDTEADIEKAYKLYHSENKGIVEVLKSRTIHHALTFDGTPAPSFVVTGLIHAIRQSS
jgi:adenylate kinase